MARANYRKTKVGSKTYYYTRTGTKWNNVSKEAYEKAQKGWKAGKAAKASHVSRTRTKLVTVSKRGKIKVNTKALDKVIKEANLDKATADQLRATVAEAEAVGKALTAETAMAMTRNYLNEDLNRKVNTALANSGIDIDEFVSLYNITKEAFLDSANWCNNVFTDPNSGEIYTLNYTYEGDVYLEPVNA